MGRVAECITIILIAVMGLICIAITILPLLGQFGASQAGYEDNDATANVPGLSSFVVPTGIPTSVFSSYYPSPSNQEPQPAIYDPIQKKTFPANLTNPDTVPDNDPDPLYYPQPIANLSKAEQQKVILNVTRQVKDVISSPNYPDDCSKCIAALNMAKSAAQLAPEMVPEALVSLCNDTGSSISSCEAKYGATKGVGSIWTQVLALADVTGLDGRYICNRLSSQYCSAPQVLPLNTTGLFLKPKPEHPTVPKASGKRVKVVHLSDIHVDPRYKVGSEANCTNSLCCRIKARNANSAPGDISFPAPAYGYYDCDTPYDLGLAALQSVGPLTGTSKEDPLAWTIYTGDLLSHDAQAELSRAYLEYTEVSVFDYMFKTYLTGPVFSALGNHDTSPSAINAPHSMPGPLGEQMSWNFDHLSALWRHEGWIDEATAAQARVHYGAYSIKNHYGLRIITFNTDFWYHNNLLNLINTSNPDVSGTFKFVIDELHAAEDAGERVWLMGHVLSGWDGLNLMPNPTNLFYQIVERFSPHVIANVFFGHTHEDQFMVFYANNGTDQSSSNALNTGWIGPSITPLHNLNSGFRLYEVDTGSFDIYEAHTFYADVDSFPKLTSHGPVFEYEYSTREAYGHATGWPDYAPLNATFWHAVTETMEKNHSLVGIFNTYQGKSSVRSPNCTSDECIAARICYMRSGSAALGSQCPQGYGSVQG